MKILKIGYCILGLSVVGLVSHLTFLALSMYESGTNILLLMLWAIFAICVFVAPFLITKTRTWSYASSAIVLILIGGYAVYTIHENSPCPDNYSPVVAKNIFTGKEEQFSNECGVPLFIWFKQRDEAPVF